MNITAQSLSVAPFLGTCNSVPKCHQWFKISYFFSDTPKQKPNQITDYQGQQNLQPDSPHPLTGKQKEGAEDVHGILFAQNGRQPHNYKEARADLTC